MANASSRASATGDREISSVRIFQASRAFVWQAWTDPHLNNVGARSVSRRLGNLIFGPAGNDADAFETGRISDNDLIKR